MDNSSLSRAVLGTELKLQERKTQRNMADIWTVKKERMVMRYCSWVETGLETVDRVNCKSWRNKIFGPNLHTEKQI